MNLDKSRKDLKSPKAMKFARLHLLSLPSGRRVLPLLLAAALTGLSSCDSRPEGVLSDDEMVQLLADMQMAEAYNQGRYGQLSDSARNALGEAVMAKHGYTYAMLDSTLAWYGRNIDNYYDLFDRVEKELTRRQQKLSGGKEDAFGADANIWPYGRYAYFSANGLTDGLFFSLPFSGLRKGESLEWRMKLSSQAEGRAMLGVDYTDGTSTVYTSSSYGDKELKVELMTDTSRSVRRIFGHLKIDRQKMPLWADSISLTRMPYDSASYYKIVQQPRFSRPKAHPRLPKAAADSLSLPTQPSQPGAR